MSEEEIYTFNEYILVYEKGNNDRSCLTISKIINGDMYVMSSLYDGSADVISMILDNLQQENKKLKEQYCERTDCSGKLGNSKKVEELEQENQQLKEEKRKVRDYINKHCVNEKISKEVGYKCYTMADTNELEKIMKILGDKE